MLDVLLDATTTTVVGATTLHEQTERSTSAPHLRRFRAPLSLALATRRHQHASMSTPYNDDDTAAQASATRGLGVVV